MLRSLAQARPAVSALRGASGFGAPPCLRCAVPQASGPGAAAHAAPLRRLRHALAAPAVTAASRLRWRAASAVAAVAAVTVGAVGVGSAPAVAAASAQSEKPREIYPPIEPYNTGMLKVSPVHTLRYEECGNKNGKPVVFLHGGPGGGCTAAHRRFFDPAAYRIILFDQRGAGGSTPHACLEDNTTQALVADIEKLREHLGIERWQVFGGSWGSTLALAYAQAHPARVTELVLRGIFLLRQKEIDWYYQGRGAEFIFPDRWEEYVKPIDPSERGDMIGAYHRVLTGSDVAKREAAAAAWTKWEMATSSLIVKDEDVARADDGKFALAFARIENHFFKNKGFFRTETQLLDDVPKIRAIPAIIVQGRYDVVCPMRSAWDLHRAWPEAQLRVIADAGHSAGEAGISAALCDATDSFRPQAK